MKGLAFIDIGRPPVRLHAGSVHHITASLLSSLVGILMDENNVVIATYLVPITFLFVTGLSKRMVALCIVIIRIRVVYG